MLTVDRSSDHRNVRALHGLTRSLLANMVHGVKDGFERKLEIVGIGYRAQLQGKNLQLALGYSHPVIFPLPDGMQAEVERQVSITLRGADKALLGQTAAKLRGAPQARSVQGQGHQVRGRVHPPQGRQEGGGKVMLTSRKVEGRKIRHLRVRACRSGAPRSGHGWPCSAA